MRICLKDVYCTFASSCVWCTGFHSNINLLAVYRDFGTTGTWTHTEAIVSYWRKLEMSFFRVFEVFPTEEKGFYKLVQLTCGREKTFLQLLQLLLVVLLNSFLIPQPCQTASQVLSPRSKVSSNFDGLQSWIGLPWIIQIWFYHSPNEKTRQKGIQFYTDICLSVWLKGPSS